MHKLTRRAVVAGLGSAAVIGRIGGAGATWSANGDGTRQGDQFPDIVYHTADGEKKSIANARGTVSMVYFWASWCPICVLDVFNIQKIRDAFKDQPKFTPIILSFLEPYKTGLAWAASKNLNLPFADSDIAGKSPVATTTTGTYSLPDTTPLYYVLDAKGVVALHNESKRNDVDEAERVIQRLLAGAA